MGLLQIGPVKPQIRSLASDVGQEMLAADVLAIGNLRLAPLGNAACSTSNKPPNINAPVSNHLTTDTSPPGAHCG